MADSHLAPLVTDLLEAGCEVRGDAAAPSGEPYPKPPGWLGDEWAAPEDEDDGLVVMLKARIENLQGQLARYNSS